MATTAKQLDAAIASLNIALADLPESEARNHAIAHLRTTARWGHQAIGVDVTALMHERDTHKETIEGQHQELARLRAENARLKGEG